MPLFAVGVVAYAAGLLAGFHGFLLLPAGLAFGIAWLSVHTRRVAPVALALWFAAGSCVATAALRRDRACADQAIHTGTLEVVLEEDAAPDGLHRAWARDCHLSAGLALVAGAGRTGDIVRVSGHVARSRRGLVVQRATLGAPTGRDALRRWRAAAGTRVDLLFGRDAPLARALLVADQRGIPAEMRDRYAAAGLTHMLSISGLHIGLIALAVALLLDLAHVSRRRAQLATVAIVTAYVALLGAPAPAVRAAAMLAVLLASQRLQRPASPWSVLAIGAALPLGDPRVVLDIGYQLSVAGVAALIAASALSARWRWLAARPRRVRLLLATILASLVATVVTAPLVAWTFGRLSLVGPLTNVLAGPIMALVQPTLFLALLLSPAPHAAHWLADAAHPLLWAFDRVASWGAAVPGGAFSVMPSTVVTGLGTIAVIALVVACVSRFPGRAVLLAAAALTAMAWQPTLPRREGRPELHVLDVERGNAIAIRTSRGRWIVMNAGRRWPAGDDGRATVAPYIAHAGGAVALFVLSADRPENVGGAASLVERLHPQAVLDGTGGRGSLAYLEMLRTVRAASISWTLAGTAAQFTVDDVHLHLVRVPLEGRRGQALVAAVRAGDMCMLIAPDFDAPGAAWAAAGLAPARSDVLVLGGQGSRVSSAAAVGNGVAPAVVVISNSARGLGTLPGPGMAWPWSRPGPLVLETARVSHVVVSVEADSLSVEADGDRWRVARRACSDPPVPSLSPSPNHHLPP